MTRLPTPAGTVTKITFEELDRRTPYRTLVTPLPFPTRDEANKTCTDAENGIHEARIKVLEWYRYIDNSKTSDEHLILNIICNTYERMMNENLQSGMGTQ